VTGLQPSLLDPPDPVVVAVLRRDAAIRRAGDATPHPWWTAAIDAIRSVAGTAATFTTDEVWTVLDRRGVGGPPEPRAMGAAMRQAQRDGLCRPTDRVVPSVRPDCHRRPVRVWEVCGP
jgi:hypothetical protein